MEFIKKIIEKIKNFINKKCLPNPKRYQLDEPKDDLAELSLKNDFKIENFDVQENNVFELSNSSKSDFFRMYENYKNGRIKPEDMLITDLIQIELMLKEEREILNKKVKEKEDEVAKQEIYIMELAKQEEMLGRKLQNN